MAQLLDHNPSPNYYANLVQNQRFALIRHLALESGEELQSIPIAFKTWGKLNARGDNVLVVHHACSGSCDIEDWWRPAIGTRSGVALDVSRFFVFCANFLGSPYGSASPLTLDPKTGERYGSAFPRTTLRDDICVQKLVLDALGVTSVAAVIGGSMGGMATLEWPLCTPPGYVKRIVPIATAARQNAWGISWSAVQRSCIVHDPGFRDGKYVPDPAGQPYVGMATARQIAMLTYRSATSFDQRFGRNLPLSQDQRLSKKGQVNGMMVTAISSDTQLSKLDFAAQGYLQYQGDKFLQRFDANCYLHMLDKMDLHDLTRERSESEDDETAGLARILSSMPRHPLVVSVETDLLFRPEQQVELAAMMPDAELVLVPSQDGHDGFLLEFEVLNNAISRYLQEQFPSFYEGDPMIKTDIDMNIGVKSSLFGEME